MLSKVKLLSKETSELIAAGEVIERPSSVIKELIENSIDSGADNITVEIKNGGISYIRVTDNGCGMEQDDVKMAFLRHATSKIASKDDLNNIHTLGFRGEALASICAVAKVEVLTKTPGSLYGTHYVIEGSEEKVIEQTGCPEGTTIIIRDIFYNVPARLKFLKKDVAEGNAISDITSKIALSHPEISFKFIRNNRQDFLTPGDSELYSSVYSIMGRDFAESMIPVDYELNGVRIKGFTVKPVLGRAKRSFQFFFVNGRYVKAYTCTSALEEAYRNCMMEGKFPACVLLINISPAMLDVNVHPAKTEVRFTDDRVIHDGIYFSVKNAILADSQPMEMQFRRTVPDYTKPLPESYDTGKQLMFNNTAVNEIPNPSNSAPVYGVAVKPVKTEQYYMPNEYVPQTNSVPQFQTQPKPQPIPEPIEPKQVSVNIEYSDSADDKLQTNVPYQIEDAESGESLDNIVPEEPRHTDYKYFDPENITAPIKEPVIEKPASEIFFRVIGEAFKNYIVTEIDDSIVFVDKHAAHERILFERLKSGQQLLQCQMLLMPVDVMLSYEEYDALVSNKKTAEELGFSFNEKRNSAVSVNGIPAILDGCDVADLTVELAHNFSENKNNPMPEILDDMYHTFACKAAIKANDKNDLKELSSIVRTLLENETIRYCPHGRPVMFKLTKYELEKQFKRIV